MRILQTLIFGFIFVLPSTVLAAGFDLINITTLPKTPGPNEPVTIRIESYAVGLNSANITWYVNSVPKKNGVAEKSITFETGDFGEKTTIDILILTAEGLKIDKQIVIAPAEIDLLWEAQTYTPPFYKGKALPTYKSLIRTTAIPRYNSLSSDPRQFYYKWTINRSLGYGEALGKSSVVVPAGYAGSPVPITLETSLPGTEWKGSKGIDVAIGEAKLLFYHESPLRGVEFRRALGANDMTNETEYSIFAAPYFFSLDNLMNNTLIYTWNVNNRYQAPALHPQFLTLTKSGTNAEQYSVSLRIQNPKRILQESRVQSSVSFNEER